MLRELSWEVDFITAVPISVARRAQRGYNQAALLALPMALGINVPYRPRVLRKVRETRTQVGLTVTERRENVAQAFQANPSLVRQKSALVVDDVTTSGATIEACAMALLDAGALQVYGLTLAHAASQIGV
jgi:predicted amidophosphoribosyltransferase